MKKMMIGLLLASTSMLVMAQMTPVGLWKTIDDETKTEKSLVRISDAGGGKLTGKIEKILEADKVTAKCDKCTDSRKDQPIQGMTLFSGLTKDPDEDVIWAGAKILDPKKGEEYKMRIKMLEGGKKLQLRGYMGPFYRSQEWIRVE